MNCPQCQTANGPESAFCGNCGAQMTVAPAAASGGYPPPQGAGTPLGYGAASAPTGYDAPRATTPPGLQRRGRLRHRGAAGAVPASGGRPADADPLQPAAGQL